MLQLQSSPMTPTFAFRLADEVIIRGATYRPLERRSDGYILQRTEGGELAEFFDNGKLAHLVQKGRLVHNVGAHLPESARRRLTSPTSPISAAPDSLTRRGKRRFAYVEAFREMEAMGEVKRTDASINAAMPRLQQRAGEILGLAGAAQESQDRNIIILPTSTSASTLRRWLKAAETLGMDGHLDALSRSGNRSRRIGLEELSLMGPCVARYATERVTQETIMEDVYNAFAAENELRSKQGEQPLEYPSRETIRQAIKRLDPYQVYVAHNGEESARKKFRPVSGGLRLTRPLERVEMDEWTIDLFSICAEGNLVQHLTEEEKRALGLHKKKIRWKVTVAICATTRCIVAMRLSRSASTASAIQAIDMITRDKGIWTDAFSALSPWNMGGVPELIVTDCGSAFISFETRAAMQDLGIRAERAPAGFPEMRARIERFFLTAIHSLLPRLTGRTFSDVVEKGDADPEARAALTTEDLSEALVRWVVDVYHNTPHEGLGGETPASCWNRLAEHYGVRPAPDMRRRRLVFGTRIVRTVSKKGVRVLGAWYHSEALARWQMHSAEHEVQVRWYQEDIGAIMVNIDGQWIEVPAVLEDLRGVNAETWATTVRHMRASFHMQAELTSPVVRQAIKDIEILNAAAMKRQGLVVQDWSEEQLASMEDRLMIGFDVAADPDQSDASAGAARSEWGYELPIGGQPRHTPPGGFVDFSDDSISAPRGSTASAAWAPIIPPDEPDDDGAGGWTNEAK